MELTPQQKQQLLKQNVKCRNKDKSMHNFIAYPFRISYIGYGCCSGILSGLQKGEYKDGKSTWVKYDKEIYFDQFFSIKTLKLLGYDEEFVKKYCKFLNKCGFPVSYLGTESISCPDIKQGRNCTQKCIVTRIPWLKCLSPKHLLATFEATAYLTRGYYNNIPKWCIKLKKSYPKWSYADCFQIASYNGDSYSNTNALYTYWAVIGSDGTTRCSTLVPKKQYLPKLTSNYDTGKLCVGINTAMWNTRSDLKFADAVQLFQKSGPQKLYAKLKT